MFKKLAKPFLISALILGGLSIVTSQINASHINHYGFRIQRMKIPHQSIIKHHNNNSRKRLIKRHTHKRSHSIIKRNKRSIKVRHVRHNHNYPTVNNHTRDLNNASWESFGNGHYETVRSYSGPRVNFKTLRFLSPHIGGTRFIQSIATVPSGHYAFLGFTSYPDGYTKIARVNLRKKIGDVKMGPRFYGGHGQALAYSPKDKRLWLLADESGPISHGNLLEIGTNSLRPVRRVRFHMHNANLGDVLAFDNSGNAYNENRIWKWDTTRRFKAGMVILYKGTVNRRHAKFHLIKQGIRRAPGYIIQAIAYNKHTKRLYIETDDAIMSIPCNRLGKLKSRDVKETILHGHREYEGISFDKYGHAYIIISRPTEILRSTRVF